MVNEQFNLLARWKLVKQASTDRRLSAGDLAVLIAILDRINENTGAAWPGLTAIATDANVVRRAAVKSIGRLVERGYLIRQSGDRTSTNVYRMASGRLFPSDQSLPREQKGHHLGLNCSLEVGNSRSPKHTQENIPKELARPTRDIAASADALPPWLDAEAWDLWKRHRGRKLTDLAASMGIKRLEKLRGEGHDPARLIELAVESGWSSFNPRESTRFASAAVGAVPGDKRAEAEVLAANEAAIARLGGAL